MSRRPARLAFTLAAFLILKSPAAYAGGAMYDKDEWVQQRAMWAGVAATNRSMAAEIDRLRGETARLEKVQRANAELQSRADVLNQFVSSIVSNSYVEWHRADGRPFVAKLAGDDGAAAEMLLKDGKSGRVDHAKLAASDLQMIERIAPLISTHVTQGPGP